MAARVCTRSGAPANAYSATHLRAGVLAETADGSARLGHGRKRAPREPVKARSARGAVCGATAAWTALAHSATSGVPFPGAVAKWLGKGLQNLHTPVRIRSAPFTVPFSCPSP